MKAFVISFCLSLSTNVFAAANKIPVCQKFGETVSISNSKILSIKYSGQDADERSAHIRGSVTKIYSKSQNCSGCPRFQLKIGKHASDTVEVYYSGFDDKPKVKVGDKVVVCGVYIRNVGGLLDDPKSPDGGYVFDTSLTEATPYHEDGFIIVNSRLYQN